MNEPVSYPTSGNEAHNVKDVGQRKPNIGDVVIWHDPYGNPHNALVQAVWSPACINIVLVSYDDSKQDTYGRQIEHQTSQVHKSLQPVHGYYWRFPDEEPNLYKAPEQT